ncbi:MAG TPA: PilZ domain-containing protein [Planctomycetota bacterium]|nr:PilZ domain-containing protein [Planctomycetota bacterium]
MSDRDFTDEKLKNMLKDAGLDPATAAVDRRQWLRYDARGAVAFHRPQEKDVHTGKLVDISDGGLAFVTRVSLAVGETLRLSYQEEDGPKAVEAKVETVHSHPRDDSYLVGVRFVR